MRRTARTVVIAAVVGVTMAVAGCTAGAIAPEPTPTGSATAAAADPVAVASRHFAVLQRPFSSRDAFPDDGEATEPDGLVLNSQRLVAERDGTKYWVAATDDGGVSLIARNGDPDSSENWAISSGQIRSAEVVTSMLDEAGHQVALVSDGYAPEGRAELHELATNVWTADLGPQREEGSGS